MQDMDLTIQVFIFHIVNLNYFVVSFFYKRLSFMKFSRLNYCNRKGVP